MLDPTLAPYSAYIAAGSGVVSAGMHVSHLAQEGLLPPRLRLAGELVRSFWVGASVAELLHYAPGPVVWALIPILLVAGLVGGTLGPRALPWLLTAGWAMVRRLPLLVGAPDLPPPDPPPPPAKDKEP